MLKYVLSALLTCILVAPALAQLPLDAMPVRVGGFVHDDQAQPISGVTVTFTDQSTLDEYQGATDASGWYGNVGFSAVPEAPSLGILGQAYPNPFGTGTTIEIRSGSLQKTYGSAPQDLHIYDVRGRLVGSVPATSGTHEVRTRNNASLPKGAYFYRLGDEVRKMVGSPKRITVKAGGTSASEKALVQYRRVTEASGFEIEDVLVDLDEDRINFDPVALVPAIGSLLVHGRTGDEIGNLLTGGEWHFRNTVSSEEYVAALDPQGYWSVSIPDTIPADREMMVWLEGNPDVRRGTFTFMKSDSCSAVGTEFTNVDVHAGQASEGVATRAQLVYEAGHVALTFRESSAANAVLLEMIYNPFTDTGVVKNINPDRVLYNKTTNYPEGEPISPDRMLKHENALDFVASVDGLFGEIDHPFFAGTVFAEGDAFPPAEVGIRQVMVYERNDVGPGNVRYPPGQLVMTGAAGFTPESRNLYTLISEISEAHLGLNDDYATGSTEPAFNVDPDTGAIELNELGKAVTCVANTYLPGDFKIPGSK